MAARDRSLGPLPEQRPTGWHRLVFDNPPRPAPPAPSLPPPDADPVRRADGAAPASSREMRAAPTDRPASVDPSTMDAHPGPAEAAGHRRTGPPRQQIGRVLDPRPDRAHRWTPALIAAVGAAAAAAALLMITTRPAPSEPAPGPVVPSVSPSVARPGGPAPTPREVAESPAPSPADPTTLPGAAVVSTLAPGDPGFGWPSTAFGSASVAPSTER